MSVRRTTVPLLPLRPAGRSAGLLAALLLLVAAMPNAGWAQGTEDFSNLPTASSTAYQARTWVGTDGVTWTAAGARTDQTMTGRAICFGNSPTIRWVTSPVYSNGMGTLSFEYVRGFTGTGTRQLQVWVNGVQIGANITVSPTSDVVQTYSQAINIGGSVQLEIRSTGAAQVKLDNIVWTPYLAGPTVSFSAATQSTPEGSGTVPVTFNIAPATVTGGTITLNVANGPGVFYGAGGDYTTAPAGGSGTITVNVPAGATTASFNMNLINDLFWEPNKTITFAVTGVTGDLELGFPNTHVFTILNDDFTPTAFFGSTSGSFLEDAGLVNIPITITPAATAGTLTLSITNGAGATYGSDYTTAPNGSGGSITLTVPAGATTVNIPVTLLDDGAIEATEMVTFTITGATGGLLFGPSASHVLSISDNDSPPTVLEPGDLVVLAVNANTGGCIGAAGSDEFSFMSFKDIVVGTTLDLTDQGYSRCFEGQWGNNEGLLRLTRTGPTIPAGTVITLRSNGSGVITGVFPDAGWSATAIDGLLFLNLNSNGDQIFFMQGGTWVDPGTPAHNASYVGGTILYGFSTNGQWQSGICSGTVGNQNSGLPPQMECFSMEPTAASDWTKYIGPLTPTTQRGWILRIGDPGNWASYANCTAYNAATPDYAAGMVLPITTVGFTPGLWTGGVSNDWFDCKNWDDARVPGAAENVRIDQTAIQSCVVGIAPGSTAECASLLISSAGTARNLTVQANSTLAINGPLRIERLLPTGAVNATVTTNSTLLAASVQLEGQTAGVNQAILRSEQAGSQVLIETDVLIDTGGLLDLQGSGEGGILELGGNFINLNDEAAFQENFSTVRLVGNGPQVVGAAIGPEVFATLEVQKTGGDVQLASPVELRALLNLINGRILSTATELLTLRNGSAVLNASDASHVDGPVQKIGNGAFAFPVGKNNVLRPCSLSSVTGTATGFRAEYFAASPRTTFNNVLEPTLDHISDCEYWMIDRTAGTGNAVVHLTWRAPMSCGVTDPPSLRVARWDGTLWLDRGNGGEVGDNISGTIPTAAVQTLFSPWTLASINSQNPLPITLVRFDAVPVERHVELTWTTATEQDNDHFTVERSADGLTFLPLLRVEGAGTSFTPLHYRAVDNDPLPGLSYYRLRQTDLDGTSTLSEVVPVRFLGTGAEPIAVHADAAQLTVFHGFPMNSNYTLLDMTGRVVATGTVVREGVMHLPVSGLSFGAYVLRMQDGARHESVRFVR